MQVRGIGTLEFQFVTLLVPDHPDLLLVLMVPTDAATAARMRPGHAPAIKPFAPPALVRLVIYARPPRD